MYRYEEKESPLPGIVKALIVLAAGIIAGALAGRLALLPFRAPDEAMKPSITPGDRLIIAKYGTAAAGDVVLVQSPAEPDRVLLRRILAVGGDVVEIRNKIIYINDRRFNPPWKTHEADRRNFPMHFTERDTAPAVKLERNQVFVLCDNLDDSFDSRTFGPIDRERIIGTMIYRR
jgi:signal peptidase I